MFRIRSHAAMLVVAVLAAAPAALAQSADDPAPAAQPNQPVSRNAAAPPGVGLAPGAISITNPQPAQVLPPGRVTANGRVGLSGGDRIRVIYVVDVSGSTGAIVASPAAGRAAGDCNGDGVSNGADDYNTNGTSGEILDCEIAGIVALNTSLRSRTDVDVALVGFGSQAAPADVGPAAGDTSLTTPDARTQGDPNAAPDIEVVARSLRSATIGQFTSKNVGGGTNFDAPLTEVSNLVAAQGPTLVFFLSDGQASVSGTPTGPLAQVVNKGAVVNTFAVGVGTGTNACGVTAALGVIATSSRGVCTSVSDPGTLAASLPGGSGQTTLTATLESRTSSATFGPVPVPLSALSDFTVNFDNVTVGDWRIRIVATDAAAAQSVGIVEFSVADGATPTPSTVASSTSTTVGTLPAGFFIGVNPAPVAITVPPTLPPTALPPATVAPTVAPTAPPATVAQTTAAPATTPPTTPPTTVAAAVAGIQVERDVAFTGGSGERGLAETALPVVALGLLLMAASKLRRRLTRP